MDRLAVTQRITELIKKYRFALIVLVAGIMLMLLPGRQEEIVSPVTDNKVEAENTWNITEDLTRILEQIEGAGEVEVLLTVAAGESTIFQYDEDGSGRRETVIITDSGRNQSGLVHRVDPPVYQGAIIACQGADNAVVRLHIIEAVAKVTGLRTDKISVLKMK